MKLVSLVDSGSYVPLKDVSIGGIIIVRHVKAGSEEEQLVEPVAGNSVLLSSYIQWCCYSKKKNLWRYFIFVKKKKYFRSIHQIQ